jgi:hypothetical protein
MRRTWRFKMKSKTIGNTDQMALDCTSVTGNFVRMAKLSLQANVARRMWEYVDAECREVLKRNYESKEVCSAVISRRLCGH